MIVNNLFFLSQWALRHEQQHPDQFGVRLSLPRGLSGEAPAGAPEPKRVSPGSRGATKAHSTAPECGWSNKCESDYFETFLKCGPWKPKINGLKRPGVTILAANNKARNVAREYRAGEFIIPEAVTSML